MPKQIFNKPSLSRRQKILMIMGLVLLLVSFVFGIMKFRDVFHSQPAPTAEQQPAQDIDNNPVPVVTEEPEPEPVEEKPAETPKPSQAACTDYGVGDITLVVNKTRPLCPKTYTPPSLVFPGVKLRIPGNETMKIRGDVASAVQSLFAGAGAAGHDPMFSSGYRSYAYQTSLYNNYVKSSGQAAADTFSARPGYSEHQTGLGFDICNAGGCSLQESFGTTPLGQWVAAHAHEYGFIIRYPSGKQNITGYTYEPWHLRYLGVDTATQVKNSGKTLEEFYGLPAAPNYP